MFFDLANLRGNKACRQGYRRCATKRGRPRGKVQRRACSQPHARKKQTFGRSSGLTLQAGLRAPVF